MDSERSTPCPECWLYAFVPEPFRSELSPCHFIELNKDGESVHSMTRQYTEAEVEHAVRTWLKAEIRRLEQEIEANISGSSGAPAPRTSN